jgi:HPt (histidine-containing phosphotransfer) domain-containing protein
MVEWIANGGAAGNPGRAAEHTEPVLDKTMLEEIRGLDQEGGEEAVRQLAQLYVRHVTEELVSLRRAAAECQPGDVAALAHSLKGSSGNIGALRMAHLCHRLEKAAAASDTAAAPELVRRIEAEFVLVRTAVLAEVGLSERDL